MLKYFKYTTLDVYVMFDKPIYDKKSIYLQKN